MSPGDAETALERVREGEHSAALRARHQRNALSGPVQPISPSPLTSALVFPSPLVPGDLGVEGAKWHPL